MLYNTTCSSNTKLTSNAAVAEEILNKCTVNDPDVQNFDDEFYSVAFNYEFVEDTRDKGERLALTAWLLVVINT